MTGRVLANRWEVRERIGAGGFGTVYKVYDRTMQSIKALKIFDPRVADADLVAQSRLRFNREAALLDRLSTRTAHIVNISSLEEDPHDKIFYFTMEYVDGETLAGLLRREGPQSVDRVLEIARQVCEALVVAHEDKEGIVHRDLKLWNIMITNDSADEDMVKVLDFGIAKITGDHAGPQLTQGAPPGTPGYAPPEQFSNKEIDGRSDLFALGVVMYGMLSGREPWNGRPILEKHNPLEMLKHVLEGKTIPLTEWRDDVPVSVERLVMKLMEPEPENRVQSARALRGMLVDLLQGGAADSTTGSLRIVSAEAGAHILVKSGLFQVVAQGSTPWFGRDMVPGVYRVILDDPRFPKASRQVTVEAGKNIEISFASTSVDTQGGRRPATGWLPRVPAIAWAGVAVLLVVALAIFSLVPPSPVALSFDEVEARGGEIQGVTIVEASADGATISGSIGRALRRAQGFSAGLDGRSLADGIRALREAGFPLDVLPAVQGLERDMASASIPYDLQGGSNSAAHFAEQILILDEDHAGARGRLLSIGQAMAGEAQQLAEGGDLPGARRLLLACGDFSVSVNVCAALRTSYRFLP